MTVVNTLGEIHENVHTLTLYIGPERSRALIEDIVTLNPGRVILNPGTECDELEKVLGANGIAMVRGCTLVMLRSGRF